MVSFFVILISCVIFSIIFYIILGALNNSVLQLFVPIQRLTDKLNRKKFYSNLTMLILIIVCAGFREYFKLGDIYYGLWLGFFFALKDMVFAEGVLNKR